MVDNAAYQRNVAITWVLGLMLGSTGCALEWGANYSMIVTGAGVFLVGVLGMLKGPPEGK